MSIKENIKAILPDFILNIIRSLRSLYQKVALLTKYNIIIPLIHKHSLAKIRNKKAIKCVFLALDENIWKYEGLYRLMRKDSHFEPIILVCPIVNYGKDNMIYKMNNCYNYFKNNGYNVVLSYNQTSDTYVDLRKDLNPDIIFYTNPYKGLIDDRYYVDKFPDILSAYVPYSSQESIPSTAGYNLDSHNRFWRCYAVSPYHKGYSKKWAFNKGKNVVVSGYPQIESFINKDYIPSTDCWKELDSVKKRIIWAPHHTLEAAGVVNYSTFLKYADFMLDMAAKYKEKVQWVFKPHPHLYNKLLLLWGRDKTEEYYRQWKDMDNTSFVDSGYIDLFLTSDAMIHDSGSFVVEYLYVNKPVLRPTNGIPFHSLYNEYGLECLDNYYLAESENDIEQFIQMIIAEEDPLKEKRSAFIQAKLLPKGSKTPSQIILDDILSHIQK